LAFDQHRVDDDAAVMGDGVVLDADTAGLAVDLDDRDMDGIAPGDRLRLPIANLFETGLDLRRAGDLPAGTRGLRHLGEAHLRTRHADHADAAGAQFEIGRRAFEEMGRDRKDLVAQPAAGKVHRRRGGDGAAARHRAKADGNRRGVGEGQNNVLRGDFPEIGNDLGKDRLHALPLWGSAARDVDLAPGIDPAAGALERPGPGALDVIADAEAEIAVLGERLLLTPAEGVEAADGVERFLQGARVVAAVIDDRLAVPIRDADAIRHLLGADHVAP